MRYLRPLILQPQSLKSCTQRAWILYIIRELHSYQITQHRLKKDVSINNFAEDVPLEKTTSEMITLLDQILPKSLQGSYSYLTLSLFYDFGIFWHFIL